MRDTTNAEWLLCVGPAILPEAGRICLDLFAPLFASRQKVENKQHEVLKKFKRTTVRCRVKPGMTAVQDKNDSKQFDDVRNQYDLLKSLSFCSPCGNQITGASFFNYLLHGRKRKLRQGLQQRAVVVAGF